MSRCSRFISLILFPPFHYCHSTFHKIDTISTRHRLNHSHYFNIIPCTKSIVNASIAPKSFLLDCLISSTISIFSEIIAGAIDCFHIGGTLSIPFLLCPALCIRKYIIILLLLLLHHLLDLHLLLLLIQPPHLLQIIINREDDPARSYILCTILFVSGIVTFLQVDTLIIKQ